MASSLTACSMMPDVSKYLPDRKVDYKKEKQAEQDLEVPPDLTKSSIDNTRTVPDITPSGSATYSGYVGKQIASPPTSAATGSSKKMFGTKSSHSGIRMTFCCWSRTLQSA